MNKHSLTERALMYGCSGELQELEDRQMTVPLFLRPLQAMALVGALQLALRHPEYQGQTREIVKTIVARLQSEFLQYDAPHLVEMIRRGDLQEFDGAVERSEPL